MRWGKDGTCDGGGWGDVPRGCSAQSGGDWAAHYKTDGVNCNGGAYQLVCTGTPGVYTRSRAVKPIAGMPATHPKVLETICGEQLEAGQRIPASALWSTSGRATSGGDCQEVASGEFFYARNHPIKSSGNTGYSLRDAASFYLIMDAELNVFLVISLDAAPNDNPGTRSPASQAIASQAFLLSTILLPHTSVVSS